MVTDVICSSSGLFAALEGNGSDSVWTTLVGVVIHPPARRPEDENRQQPGHHEEHPRHCGGVSKIPVAESAEIEVEHIHHGRVSRSARRIAAENVDLGKNLESKTETEDDVIEDHRRQHGNRDIDESTPGARTIDRRCLIEMTRDSLQASEEYEPSLSRSVLSKDHECNFGVPWIAKPIDVWQPEPDEDLIEDALRR